MRHTSFPEGKGTSTPWGPAQTSQVLTRGVVAYSTSQHGGVSVTINWALKNLTPHAAHLGMPWGGKLWYEEDCQIVILFLEHPEFYREFHPDADYSPAALARLHESDEAQVRKYFPKYFDPEFRQACRDNPVFDARELLPGDCIRVQGIDYLVTEPMDFKGRIRLVGCVARAAQLLAHCSRVARRGRVIWSMPN